MILWSNAGVTLMVMDKPCWGSLFQFCFCMIDEYVSPKSTIIPQCFPVAPFSFCPSAYLVIFQ